MKLKISDAFMSDEAFLFLEPCNDLHTDVSQFLNSNTKLDPVKRNDQPIPLDSIRDDHLECDQHSLIIQAYKKTTNSHKNQTRHKLWIALKLKTKKKQQKKNVSNKLFKK